MSSSGIAGFVVELRRRKVFRVLAAYVVLAAGTLELVDLVIPMTRLPQWVDPLFLGLAVVGLPIVAVLAWVFDVTPEGVRRTGAVDREAASQPRPVDLDPKTVAVLPFTNLSGSAEAEPFATGLHDDLLTELSRASALTVISRTSVQKFRETGRTIPEIACELGAGIVVEGAVQKAGNRVRLNVQLIDARTDRHRWAERYDRELTAETIFDLQSELASSIMAALRAELTPAEEAREGGAPTVDLEAYRLCALGRQLFADRGKPGLERAIAYFEAALERDPDYALAWALLAMSSIAIVDYGHIPPDHPSDPLARGEAAARRSLELDPNLAEGFTARGGLHIYRKQAKPAGDALTRAIELQPSLAVPHQWLAWLNLLTGRPDRALEHAERAVRINPLDPEAGSNLALARLALGDADAAVAQAEASLEAYPAVDYLRWIRGLALLALGRRADGDAALQQLSERWARGWPEVGLALEHLDAGRSAQAEALLDSLEERPFKAGVVEAALGNRDRAFDLFGRGTPDAWDEALVLRYVRSEPIGSLRDDPRYAALVAELDRRWGLQPGMR